MFGKRISSGDTNELAQKKFKTHKLVVLAALLLLIASAQNSKAESFDYAGIWFVKETGGILNFSCKKEAFWQIEEDEKGVSIAIPDHNGAYFRSLPVTGSQLMGTGFTADNAELTVNVFFSDGKMLGHIETEFGRCSVEGQLSKSQQKLKNQLGKARAEAAALEEERNKLLQKINAAPKRNEEIEKLKQKITFLQNQQREQGGQNAEAVRKLRAKQKEQKSKLQAEIASLTKDLAAEKAKPPRIDIVGMRGDYSTAREAAFWLRASSQRGKKYTNLKQGVKVIALYELKDK